MNTYQSPSQQGPGQFSIPQQPMAYSGAGMAMHNIQMAPSSLDMNINPSSNMTMNMNTSNMNIHTPNTASINPNYLAMLQNSQQHTNPINGMMNKFPSPYPSFPNQSQQQGQQSMVLSHSQMSNMASQMHPSQTPNNIAIQNSAQSISPTQLMSASPSQLMSGPSSQQGQPHGHSLTLTPAQLLQQQQQQHSASIHPASLGNVAANMNMAGMNMNMGGMGNMAMANMNMQGMGTGMNQGLNPTVQQNVRMNFPPNMRFSQMSPQERAVFQRQQQAASLGHGLPTDRGPSATPSQSGHEHGPSLTHERPPSQHERAQSQTHERQPSQQPHERAPSQPHDPTGLPNERPSSSASVRSHHSHHNMDMSAPHSMMGPPGSRPNTASGAMSQLTRMNSMNINSGINPMHMSSGAAPTMNPNMGTHMNPSVGMMPSMSQPPQINAGMNMNPQMGQMSVTGGMGMPMNRPPTRTGSALGSPKHSPRLGLGAGGPAPMGPTMGMAGGPGMGVMNPNVQGSMASGMSGSMGGGMSSGMGGGMSGPMSAGMSMSMNTQGISGVPNMSGMGGMNNMGPMGMNTSGPSGLGPNGMVGVGTGVGGLMGPPVIPPTMQRSEREQMMQAQVRDRSASVQRESSLPPSSSGQFLSQSLDNPNVSNLSVMVPNIPSSIPGVPRQPSQPPVHPHQQSPLRKLPVSHPSQIPAARKPNEMAVPAAAAVVNATPVVGPPVVNAPPGQKLPPHLAALNPAVTKITYLPSTTSKSSDGPDGAEEDKNSDDGASQPEGDESKDVKPTPDKGEDPVPALTPSEITILKGIMDRDAAHEAINRTKQNRMMQEMRTAGPMSRVAWWDRDFASHLGMNRRPDVRFDVRYPRPPKSDGNVPRRKGARREGIRIPRRLPSELTDRPEQLVPIRLEFDVEHHKMRDTFLWNLNDPVITPEMFAQTLVEDYSLSPSYHSVIVKSIQEQLSDFKAHMIDMDWRLPTSAVEISPSDEPRTEEPEATWSEEQNTHEPVDNAEQRVDADDDSVVIMKGTMDENDVRWWESWQKRCKKHPPVRSIVLNNRRKKRKIAVEGATSRRPVANDDNKPHTPNEFEIDEAKMHEDLRILIKLDIIVGSVKLDDQFEWDLENLDASPEQFAEVYAKELGLGGEFKTAIAHCIREQVHVYQKSLFLVGHPSDGSAVQDEDLRVAFLPSLTSGTRPMDQVQSYTPMLNYLSDGEIERSEKEREKELTKRRKRNTRGRRGIALPDREPNRTYRTPALGFPELDPATLALAAAANAPTSRRAAAAAASLTIANMVASENGTPIMPIQLPPQQPTSMAPLTPGKEKKPKGLFKPPSFPSSVLRPRAQVTAPTPSTAVESTSIPSSLLDNEPPPPPPPVVNTAPPDLKAAAKKAREAEREAKEKELADGQHTNFIDGVWHCSNCGCPESIAIGRRKGPLGDKSQCGTCGKFWHRHRRLRPVEYNSDPQYHLNLRNEAEQAKTSAKKRGRAPNSSAVAEGTDTPSRQKSEAEAPPPTIPSTVPPSEDDRPASPASSVSSGDEAPLAQQFLKTNGASQSVAPSSRPATPDSPRAPPNTQLTSPSEPGFGAAAPQSNGSNVLPPWLTSAIHDLQAKYPDDRFEAILRKPAPKAAPEWRIKCLDCPGKLYNPGPGDTLSNYEVHLRNRQHRLRVNNRLNSSFS